MSDAWFSLFWAPLLVGVLLWLAADAVRAGLNRRKARRERRLRIIGALNRADAMVFRAARDGQYVRSWTEKSLEPLRRVQERYDDLVVETLDLFEMGEEDVAFWVAVELYAGFLEPLYWLDAHAEEFGQDGGAPYLNFEVRGMRLPDGWTPPRADMLLEWAGGGKGPRYGDLFTSGDHARHLVVIPNSDVNLGMLRPPIWILARSAKAGGRASRKQDPPSATPAEIAECPRCSGRVRLQHPQVR